MARIKYKGVGGTSKKCNTSQSFYYALLLTQVTYSVEGFLDKNKDLLFKDLSQAMYACERPLLKELFPEGDYLTKIIIATNDYFSNVYIGDPTMESKKRPHTTGYQFRNSVSDLMKNLLSKNPNYIRCIKPNDTKEPNRYYL